MVLTQPTLIKCIIEAVGLDPNDKKQRTYDLPATKPILQKDTGGAEALGTFNYRSVIGMLNFLTRSTRPELAFAVHQCARFMTNPKKCHERAIYRIVRYLMGTQDKGMIIKPKNESFICYVDADFSGGYHKGHTHDPDTAKSRTGYVIMYNGCPILWNSKLQSEITLSTTEAEYVALSQALREVIPMIELVKEIQNKCPTVQWAKPIVKCKVFEDNSGALELANTPKLRPRTKHINIKYHHFRSHIEKKTISISKIDTKDQIADIFTKPLEKKLFIPLRRQLQGW